MFDECTPDAETVAAMRAMLVATYWPTTEALYGDCIGCSNLALAALELAGWTPGELTSAWLRQEFDLDV